MGTASRECKADLSSIFDNEIASFNIDHRLQSESSRASLCVGCVSIECNVGEKGRTQIGTKSANSCLIPLSMYIGRFEHCFPHGHVSGEHV